MQARTTEMNLLTKMMNTQPNDQTRNLNTREIIANETKANS